MIIYDITLRLKEENGEFYVKHANYGKCEECRIIFDFLARDEERQKQIIEKLISHVPEYIKSEALAKFRNMFHMEGFFSKTDRIGNDDVEILKQAIIMQEETLYIYKRLIDEVEYDHEKTTFKKLAEDVKEQITMINSALELLR